MKEYRSSKENHIGGWYIDESICDKLIDYFNLNKHQHVKGITGKGYRTEHKDSTDLEIGPGREDVPFNLYRKSLQECLDLYCEKYSFLKGFKKFNIIDNYNLQYYKPNQGFKAWHSERQDLATTRRMLVFMTYLNNVPDGGTEFLYQKIITPAEKGLTLIWPTDWTHTHKGQISKVNEKYIITGWFEFCE